MTRSTFLTSLASVALLGLLIGCGPRPAEAPPGSVAVTAITITGDDRMRFAPREFTVERGREITLEFHNIGSMPKDSMGHNLIILRPGTNVQGFAAAGMGHPARSHVAPAHDDRVVAVTPVLGPGERHTVVFSVPDEPGEYPFVCSFPGHTPAGMVGKMIVR